MADSMVPSSVTVSGFLIEPASTQRLAVFNMRDEQTACCALLIAQATVMAPGQAAFVMNLR
ncbi:hypothetical protein [Tateyamaria sp. Alg231-49]|uniref:hypothetical protein n=1 Tax=Tateyamaria sp. Alg231-49 TaxID=1922219 RepID=UPI00131EE7C1|nr:hypothetical protein [Tateyamaria sp. Alg231-49]